MATEKKITEMNLRELNAKAAKIWHGEMNERKFVDLFRDAQLGKEIPKDQEEQFDKWNEEIRAIDVEIKIRERDERMAELEARAAGPKATGRPEIDDVEEKYDPAFKPTAKEVRSAHAKLQKRGYAALNRNEKKIANLLETEERAFMTAMKAGFDPGQVDAETRGILDAREQRAQTVTTTGGGYLIPEGFISDVVRSMSLISPFFEEFTLGPTGQAKSLFNFRRTASGNNIPWPTYDDTSNTGELLAINTTIGSATDMTFGRVVLLAYKYSSKPILVPYELFEDEGVGLNELVTDTMATRLGRIANTHLTTGDNSSKPQGIVIGAAAGKVSASATAVTFPEIIDLVHSVNPAYRKSPHCRFMMHDNILLYLKKLTVGSSTANARPLWAPGYDVQAPATIDGFQYVLNQDMASSVATNSKIILFGDMKQYAVRFVNEARVYKLEERYRDTDQTGFVAFYRLDGRILNSAAIKYLRTT